MEVKRIGREMVKPCEPTPSHLRTLKLSSLDQLASPCYIPMIFFFPSSSSSSSSPDDHDQDDQVMMKMKSSLSKTLSTFYPLAGRFQDDSTLECNDEGVLLIHARVTCTLDSYFKLLLNSLYSGSGSGEDEPVLKRILPASDLLSGSHQPPIPISAWIQYVIQVNFFECGSIAIASYWCHKIQDGTSAATFFRHWAGLNLGLAQDKLVQPNFDAIVSAFPPFDVDELCRRKTGIRDQWLEESVQRTTSSSIMLKPFVFKPESITAIRKLAASDHTPNPTRVESIVAFLWKHCLEAEAAPEVETNAGVTEVLLTLDMRSRAHPPLPRETIGNLATNVAARSDKDRASLGLGLANLAGEVRGAITNFKEELIGEFEGENGLDALWEHMQMIHRASSGKAGMTYRVSCQSQIGYKELDFGFGKPMWVTILSGVLFPILKNLIILMDKNDGGFEAWLTLDKKQMKRLETNPDFITFTSMLDLNI